MSLCGNIHKMYYLMVTMIMMIIATKTTASISATITTIIVPMELIVVSPVPVTN